MKYNLLPKTTLNISSISLGTWVFGGTNWGDTNEKILVEAVHAASNLGVNLIDTAPVYGYGKAEEIIGRAINKNRDNFVIATKCGLLGKGKQTRHDLSSKSILKEIDASLKRLQTDYIDIYQCHWPDINTPIEETLNTLDELKKIGKIRYIGVSNFDENLFKKSCRLTKIASYQGQLSLFERSTEKELFSALRKEDVGLLVYGALGGGILSGKYTSIPKLKRNDARSFFYQFYSEKNIQKSLEILEGLRKFNRPLNQLALNWVRRKSCVSSVIVGCRNKEQVKQNMDASTWDLTDEESEEINKIISDYPRDSVF